MDTVRQMWPFLVLLLHLHCASAQNFEISRPVTGLDTFNVSSSMCGGSRYRCSTFNALEQQVPSCSCSCPGPRSTFTFANNRWMCMANAQARDKFQQGCDSRTKLSGEVADNRIPTLTIGGRAQIAMRYWQWQHWKCSLDFSSSSFIGCNGSRILFTQRYYRIASQLFSLTRINTADRYVLKVSSGTPGSTLLQGKIINLSMRCGSDLVLVGITIDICLLIKIQGEETCPTYEPTISTSSTIQPLTTMYSHGSTVSRLKTSTKAIQPSSTVPSTLATPSYTYLTPKISDSTPSVAHVTTLTSSNAILTVSSRAPASSDATSKIFATSTIGLRTSLRTSVITPSASVSSHVASYSSRRAPSSSQRVSTPVISSTTLLSSPNPFSSRRSETASYATATTYVTQTVVSDTLHRVSKSALTVSNTLASVSDTSPTASAFFTTTIPTASSTTVSSPTFLAATPKTSVRSFITSRSLPKASTNLSKASSVTSEGGVVVEILPTSLNILPTVKIPPEVVEVSPTTNEGEGSPVLPPPPEEGGIEPGTNEPNIPPNVGSGRKGRNMNGLYIGVSIGITAFIITILVVVGFLIYRRHRSNLQPRMRTLSEETKISELAMPRLNSAFEPEEADDTLRRSSMYVPHYGIPLWEDEPDNGPIYAVIRFPDGADPGAANDDEPFYYVLEEAEVNEKEIEENSALEDPALLKPGSQFKEDHIYAEVDFSKKRLVRNSIRITDMSELINSKENSGSSDSGSEPVIEVLKPYVRSATESEESDTGSDKSVYFTLEKCFSDTFKRTTNDSESQDEPVRRGPEGPDQYKAVCTEALVYYTLKRSGSGRQNNNNSKFTIGQVFDQLEERYLNKAEQPGTPLPARPGLLLPRRISSKKDKSDAEGTSEPVVYNFLEEVCNKGIPTYRPVSNHEGPVYFHLKRLKSNHSRATRIQPKWGDGPVYTVLGDQYLKGAAENDKPEEKSVYLTLEALCSDTLNRASGDGQDTDELANDLSDDCYPVNIVDTNRTQRPGCYTMKRIYPKSVKKDESPC